MPAKRYLVTVEPTYRDTLDVGSTSSLELQGAAMTSREVTEFEAEPHHLDAVVVRRADEAAKVHGLSRRSPRHVAPAARARRRRGAHLTSAGSTVDGCMIDV